MIRRWRIERSQVWVKNNGAGNESTTGGNEPTSCVYLWLCEEWIYMRFTVPGIADTIATQSRDT